MGHSCYSQFGSLGCYSSLLPFSLKIGWVYDILEKMRNVFISFDVGDEGMINLLRMQAKNKQFPFVFRDYSVKEPFERGWKREVRNLIRQSSAVIVAIGKNTHKSRAVEWEIDEAHEQDKQVIGIRLHRNNRHKIPYAMDEFDEITYWDTDEIADILGEE